MSVHNGFHFPPTLIKQVKVGKIKRKTAVSFTLRLNVYPASREMLGRHACFLTQSQRHHYYFEINLEYKTHYKCRRLCGK